MKVVTVVGARPQFIKFGPVFRALRKVAVEILVHTGQHYDANMSDIFFRDLDLPEPDYHLGVGSGSHGAQTGEMLKGIEVVLLKEKPDYVFVYGDTNSTLAGALAAAKLHIPIGHVEAGLRSFNRKMPEEVNRVVTDHLSNLLFCPTEAAIQNLEREGIQEGVYRVGDVMFDSVLYFGERAKERSEILNELKLGPKAYALATIHRAENTDDSERFQSIFEALDTIAEKELPVVIPLHPRSRKQMNALGLSFPNLRVLEPVSYLDMLRLEQEARVILTDSGGVQKEAYFFQVPCITLRDETEWVETVETGWNVLAGANTQNILQRFKDVKKGARFPDYGTGDAAQKIAQVFVQQSSMVPTVR
ncbi:MAG: UDP-N-acetylglucosamine 2-epimerase (non-hydrolyzing) [Candidatus Omnitrophica bacterium]|nr:UDP-N-acetylglucosamine 2-epimerase (non-hydrolyzing) [Candidatus Omnitrophota bacterium]